MFQKDPNNKQTPSLFAGASQNTPLFGNQQTSLFGNSSQSGPLFGGNSGPLFGNQSTTGQKSLFGNIQTAAQPTQKTTNQSEVPSAQGLGGSLFGGIGSQSEKQKTVAIDNVNIQSKAAEGQKQKKVENSEGGKQTGLFGGKGASLFGQSSSSGSLLLGPLFGKPDNNQKSKENGQKDKVAQLPASNNLQNSKDPNAKNDNEKQRATGNPLGPVLGSGPLFGKKEEGPSMFSGLFGKKEEKKDSSTSQPLFGGINFTAQPNSAPAAENKPETVEKQQPQKMLSGSLFGSGSQTAPSPLFAPKKPQAPQSQSSEAQKSSLFGISLINKPKQENSQQPKTQILATGPNEAPASSPKLFSFKQKQESQGSLFGSQPSKTLPSQPKVQTVKNGGQDGKDKSSSGLGLGIGYSFAKTDSNQPKTDQGAAENASKAVQQSKPSATLFGQSLFGESKKQEKKIDSLFGLPSQNKEEKKISQQENTNQPINFGVVPDKKDQANADKAKQFQTETNVTATHTQRTDRSGLPRQTEGSSNRMTQSILTTEKSQQDGRAPVEMQREQSQTRPFLSTIKARPIASKEFIDYKTLKEEESSETFQLYLTQKKADIVQSIKIYFGVRTEEPKVRDIDSKVSDKVRFYCDLGDLLVKVLHAENSSVGIVEGFARRVINEEKYEKQLFTDDQFVQSYFSHNCIYYQNYSGKVLLNQNSAELRLLVQKIVHKWFTEKINYLNFLFRYPDLIRPREDLFAYLFKSLLKQERSNSMSAESSPLSHLIRDLNRMVTSKLVQLLQFYNKKLGKSYKLLGDEPDKFFISTLPYIEVVSRDEVVSVYLKVILTALNLQQHERFSTQLFRAIRETKSKALLPLRVIMPKLREGRLDFAPGPKDLYQFIKGDEWADWIDLYLSPNSNQKFSIELQSDQPRYLVQSLSTMSGSVLIDRLITAKKGIFKFFELLREQNLVEYYYKILETCLYNQQSIKEIDQFYFKRVYFNFEYQEIIEYVINFHENLGKPEQPNETTLFKTLPPKIALLTKILQIEPEKLFDLERYIFYPEFNPNKRFKAAEGAENIQRQGHKMVHIFIDLIKIVSLKGLTCKILPGVFRAFVSLLRNRKTEPIILAATNISEPCFDFVSSGQCNHEVTTAMSEFLEEVVSGNYLSELMLEGRGESRQVTTTGQEIRMELFYPFRYNNAEFSKLASCQTVEYQSFSLKWINQLFLAVSKQKFNPHLLEQLLSKLYIVPFGGEEQGRKGEQGFGIKRYRRAQSQISRIFQMIVNLCNSYSIWQEISKALEWRVTREQGYFLVVNKYNSSTPSLSFTQEDSFSANRYLFSVLKLLKTIFMLNEVLLKHQMKSPNHFIVKTLSSVNILSRIEINAAVSTQSQKGNLLLGLLACVQPRQEMNNDSAKSLVWEAQQAEDDSTRTQLVLSYLKKNKDRLDFEQISNFYKNSSDKYLENEDNLTTLALQNIVYLLRICTDCSLEYSLLTCWRLPQEQKLQLKGDVIRHLTSTIGYYISDQQYQSIKHKFFAFIYSLKYELRDNKVNHGLSEALFVEFMRMHKPNGPESRLNHLLLKYMAHEKANGEEKYEAYSEQTVLRILTDFEMRESPVEGGHLIKDSREIGDILLRYHERQFSLLNFNQLERLIEEKALIEIAQSMSCLAQAAEILVGQVISKRYSVTLTRALQALSKFIAEKNMILLQNDIPFEHKALAGITQEELKERLEKPRQFLRDPLQLFLSQGKGINQRADLQTYQKNNLIQWFIQIAEMTCEKLTAYLQLILTVDRTFYSNNPVRFETTREDLASKELFFHLSLGKTALSAIDLFGRSETDAVGVVHLIAQNIVGRLFYLHQSLSREQAPLQQEQKKQQKLGLKVLGQCLQWLRARKGLGDVVRRITRNYKCLLPSGKQLLCEGQLRVLQSYLSSGEPIPNHVKYDIHQQISNLLDRYCHTRKELKQYSSAQDGQMELALLLQQAFSLFLVCPPESNQTAVFEQIISIWSSEPNHRYFYNESRVLLELAKLYPEEMARLRLLSRLEILDSNRTPQNLYRDEERTPESLRWLWTVKIATTLAQSHTTMSRQEVTDFFINYKTKILKILEGGESKLTRAYLQQLQGVLELILTLFSQPLWVSFNRQVLEEVTFALSHQLLRWLVVAAQGVGGGVARSKNEKILSEVKVSASFQQNQMVQDYRSDNLQNLLSFELKFKLNYCIRYFCMVMQQGFKLSHFIQKHFSDNVSASNRYLTSFWDSFNKNLIVLFNYSLTRLDYWIKAKRTKQILRLLNDCYNAPHTFFENGYLTTIIELPVTEEEVIGDHYLLVYLLAELGVVHGLKQRVYASKYGNLMVAQIQAFMRRIKEHISKAREVGKKIMVTGCEYVREEHFKKLVEIVQNKQ